MFVLIGTLSMLALLSVGQDSLAAGSATVFSFQTTGDALLAVRDWVFGFVAASLSLVATIYSGFTQDFGFSTVNSVLNIPIALQEMVLAVWLIAKGFNKSALACD